MKEKRGVVEGTRYRLRKIGQDVAHRDFRKALRDTGRFLRDYAHVHQSLIALTIFMLINNLLVVNSATASSIPDVSVSDPYQIADTVRLLADYTPDIKEDPENIAYSLEERTSGSFLKTNALVASAPGATDALPAADTTSSPSVSTVRSEDSKYTVQIGDTLGEIGAKFNLRLATIRVKNNLGDIDSLKPGQELTIPGQDLSDKAIKAADDRKKASADLASGQANRKVAGGTPSGGFGFIIPIHSNGISRGISAGHDGIDYRANVGTPVMAAADGVVVQADFGGWNGGFGTTLLIAHTNGVTTRYGHCSQLFVHSGEHVQQGEVIAYSGNTGRSTGPHLHFEVRQNGQVRHPFPGT